MKVLVACKGQSLDCEILDTSNVQCSGKTEYEGEGLETLVLLHDLRQRDASAVVNLRTPGLEGEGLEALVEDGGGGIFKT